MNKWREENPYDSKFDKGKQYISNDALVSLGLSNPGMPLCMMNVRLVCCPACHIFMQVDSKLLVVWT